MTPDPDSVPERPEVNSEPVSLPSEDTRAIEAAVAGAAGLLLGRVLLGRAGGLAAGLVAVGAGLLMKRAAQAKKTDSDMVPEPLIPGPLAVVAEDLPVAVVEPPAVPGTQVRLETGPVAPVDAWTGLPALTAFAPVQDEGTGIQAPGETAKETPLEAGTPVDEPLFPDGDAGVFAEEPAWFEEPPPPEAPRPVVPLVPAASDGSEGISFDDTPEPVVVELLPVAALVEMALEEAKPEEAQTEPPKLEAVTLSASEAPVLGPIHGLPAEFVALKEDEAPGPREDFLIVPDFPSSYPPPLQPVVAELNKSLEALASMVAGSAPPAAVVQEPSLPELESSAPVPGPTTAESPEIEAGEDPLDEVPVFVPAANSPFRVWKQPEPPAETAFQPAVETGPLVPVPETAPLTLVGEDKAKALESAATAEAPGSSAPVADPEEIWRQAAVELASMKSPLRPVVEEEPPWAAMLAQPPPIAPLPPVPFSETIPLQSGPPAAPPAELPPWLKNIAGETAPVRLPEDPAAGNKPFLPTIRLAVPQGPQPMSARRPASVFGESPVPLPAPLPSPLTSPLSLPGYRAEPLPPDEPPAPASGTEAVLDIDAPAPALPPFPVAPAPVNPPAPVAAPVSFLSSRSGGAAGEEDKVYVPLSRSSRSDPKPRRSLVTPARVGVLAIIAAGTLAVAFKPQIKAFWNERILGRLPKKESVPPPVSPSAGASDVNITPDPPASPKPEAKVPTPPSSPEGKPPAVTPPDSVTPPATPPPAEPAPTGPLPEGEAGARQLITRLLLATTPEAVKPYILDASRVAPGLEAYFSGPGRAEPAPASGIDLIDTGKSSPSGRILWNFKVITRAVPKGFPLAVEDTPDGLRTDWEFFAQCRDDRLKTFLNNPAAPSGLFFVSLMRAHPFPDMLPAKDFPNFVLFTIAPPGPGEDRANVFVRKDTPLADRVEKLYAWGTLYAPVLTLTHKSGFVEITGIARENWRPSVPASLGSSR